MDTSPLLSIGQFARQVGLSVSAVRFYADRGLLVPAHIDPQTGYRYYAAEQVSVGQQVAALRQLEVPLDDLSMWLRGAPDAGAAMLAGHEQRLYDRFQVQRALLGRVSGLVDGQRPLPCLNVQFGMWPAQDVLSLPTSAVAEDFHPAYTAALTTLLTQAGGAVSGADFGLYHAGEYLGGPLQVEVCLPVTRSVPVTAPVRRLHMPATRVASAVHAGNWTTFSLTFAALHLAMRDSDHAVHGTFTRAGMTGMELGLLLA